MSISLIRLGDFVYFHDSGNGQPGEMRGVCDSTNSTAGLDYIPPQAKRLSRHEKLGGDWVGFQQSQHSGSAVPDSVYFTVRGLMVVGAHGDRMGKYTVDGIINTRDDSISFNKTYAKSRATLEYDCKLWDGVSLYVHVPLLCDWLFAEVAKGGWVLALY